MTAMMTAPTFYDRNGDKIHRINYRGIFNHTRRKVFFEKVTMYHHCLEISL